MAADIERAALELFVERGFDDVTVDDIASAVDISRRTFFRYFPSKDAVLLGDPRRDEQIVLAALDAQPDDISAVDALHAALRTVAADQASDPITTRLRIQVLDDAPDAMAAAFGQRHMLQHQLTPVIARRMGLHPTADMRPSLVVHVSMAAMYVGIWHWLHTDATAPLDALVAEALQGAAAGLTDAAAAGTTKSPGVSRKRPAAASRRGR
jgi:AcrR family transcriptional regulator